MLPGWVRTLEDYSIWLEQVLEASGGYIEENALIIEPVEDAWGEVAALNIGRQRLYLWSDTHLEFEMLINEDLVAEEYVFQLVRSGENPGSIWGKHKHPGHEELGGPEHFHHEAAEEPVAYHEVDLEEAIAQAVGSL